jgi:ABC-2 type transport system ATP-binding protein
VLVLDEPTVGLDIPSRQGLVEMVHRLAYRGLGVFWTTHLVDEVRAEDEVVVLVDGRVRAAGAVGDVLGGDADLGTAYRRLTTP